MHQTLRRCQNPRRVDTQKRRIERTVRPSRLEERELFGRGEDWAVGSAGGGFVFDGRLGKPLVWEIISEWEGSGRLTMTLEGGHGRSAKLKDLVALAGMDERSQTGISIVDSTPGANASTV